MNLLVGTNFIIEIKTVLPIIDKIKNGKAHEISEADTMYIDNSQNY